MVVLIAGIIGIAIAPTTGMATLPIAMAVVGLASSTLPTGKLLGRFGRRKVFIGYAVLAIGSALFASASLVQGNFAGFSLASFLMGWSAAAGHQYRFAALEAVPAQQAPKATSALLLGGLLGAFVGPELAVRGHWLLDTEFAGSFLLLAGAYVVGLLIISFYRDSKHFASVHSTGGRAIFTILRSPAVVLAIGASGIAYGVMSLIMSATPISMTQHSHHSLEATKVVIQSHIAGMFLPSLLYSYLFSRLGFKGMLWSGLVILFSCLVVALLDTDFMHYWLALVLLGIGWNFLYLTGTNLLVYGYQPEERFRVQSTNDFLVFTIQALVSFSSGWLVVQWQWQGLQLACLPLLILFMVMLARTDFATLTPAKSS
jgi:MFS family permease